MTGLTPLDRPRKALNRNSAFLYLTGLILSEVAELLSAFKNDPPRKVFITHGEEEASKTFAEVVEHKLGFDTEWPSRCDKYVLK